MKTPHQQNDVAARTQAHGAKTRAKRTAAKFACEALEGRNLMTGIAGAGAMMGHGFAEMGDMGGPGGGDFQRHDRMDRFGGPDAGSAQADATGSASATTGATSSGTTSGANSTGPAGWTPSFAHDGRTDGDRGFGGQDGRMEGRFGDRTDDSSGPMGDRDGDRDIPLAGPGGRDDSGQDSTGSTQLQTDTEKLRTDEQAIHDKSQVTPALQAAVRKDQQAIDAAKTGTASATATQQLKTDEQAIFGTQSTSSTSMTPGTPTTPPTLTDAQKATLQADHDAILTSQGVSQDLIDQLAKDQLAVKTASNFTDADQATLDADHKAIQADLQAFRSNDGTAPVGGSAATSSTPDAAPTSTTTAATPTPTATSGTTDPSNPATGTTAPAMPTTSGDAPAGFGDWSGKGGRRADMGGGDAHFMHRASTHDDFSAHPDDMGGRSGGGRSVGAGFGGVRDDFRR